MDDVFHRPSNKTTLRKEIDFKNTSRSFGSPQVCIQNERAKYVCVVFVLDEWMNTRIIINQSNLESSSINQWSSFTTTSSSTVLVSIRSCQRRSKRGWPLRVTIIVEAERFYDKAILKYLSITPILKKTLDNDAPSNKNYWHVYY